MYIIFRRARLKKGAKKHTYSRKMGAGMPMQITINILGLQSQLSIWVITFLVK